MIKRKRHSAKVKAAIIARQGGLCALSGKPLVAGLIQFDHVIPLALGGADDPSNMEALAKVAHGEKTKTDVARIAKAKRQRARHEGTKRAGRKIPAHVSGIQGRGFDRSKTRKFNGSVIPRAPRAAQ